MRQGLIDWKTSKLEKCLTHFQYYISRGSLKMIRIKSASDVNAGCKLANAKHS